MNFQSLIENSKRNHYELTFTRCDRLCFYKIWGIIGRETHEMIGKNFASFIHTEDKQKWLIFLNTIKLGKRQQNITIEYYINKDTVWHSSTIILIEKITKTLHRNCSDITRLSKTNKTQQRSFAEAY
jgi:hypothetical protein